MECQNPESGKRQNRNKWGFRFQHFPIWNVRALKFLGSKPNIWLVLKRPEWQNLNQFFMDVLFLDINYRLKSEQKPSGTGPKVDRPRRKRHTVERWNLNVRILAVTGLVRLQYVFGFEIGTFFVRFVRISVVRLVAIFRSVARLDHCIQPNLQ